MDGSYHRMLFDVSAPTSDHVVILASAGTGKTHQLSSRYLRLVESGFPIERILATTFTRKAAGEILDRVLQRLAKSATDKTHRELLRADLKVDRLTTDRCRELLAKMTTELHRVRISTLDSFFGQIARTFGLELGLPPGWTILDEHDDFGLRRQALEQMLADGNSAAITELISLLTKGEADRRISDMLLDILHQVYELYQETQPDGGAAWQAIPPAICLPEDELRSVRQAFAAVSLPAHKGVRKAHHTAQNCVDEEAWEDFLHLGITAKMLTDEETYYNWTITSEVKAVYQPLIQHATGRLLNRLIKQTEGAFKLAQEFDQFYERLKLQREAILFNDVPQRLNALAEGADNRRLAFRMDSQIDHLLLDEFQDTSGTQWQALRAFARRVTDTVDGSQSFFCVGDTKQAIYGWRGGQAEILESLPRQLDHVKSQQLNDSRRSSLAIIEVVNQIFTQLPQHAALDEQRAAFASWCGQFPQHSTTRSEPGYACLQVATAAAATAAGGRPPANADQATLTLPYTAHAVQQMIQEAPGHSIGILVRRNEVVGRMIHHLREIGIHASEEGGNPLTDAEAVRQILSLMRLADHPRDRIAHFHLRHGPLAAALGILPSAAGQSHSPNYLSYQIRRELLDVGYGAAVKKWADVVAGWCSPRELQRLGQLVDLAFAYQSRSTLRPSDFVRFVETEKVQDPTTADVRVMTIHQAKGLEFDIVVLTSLDENYLRPPSFVVARSPTTFRPTSICRYASTSLQQALPRELQRTFEEDLRRRIHEYLCGLYVAVTRARRALHMIIAPSSPSSSTRELPRTTAGLLRAALAGGRAATPGAKIYEHGDRQWFRHGERRFAHPSGPLAQPPQPSHIARGAPAAQRTAGRAISPSQLAAGSRLRGRELFSLARERSLAYGTLIHAWLETITWLDDGPPAESELRAIAIRQGWQWSTAESKVPHFRRMLAQPQIQGLLHRRDYEADVRDWLTEWQAALGPLRFQVRHEQSIVWEDAGQFGTGSIDRLVLVYRGDQLLAADIIDYKTDPAPDDTAVQEKSRHYEPQLAAYRASAARMFRLPEDRLRCRLAFLNSNVVATLKPRLSASL